MKRVLAFVAVLSALAATACSKDWFGNEPGATPTPTIDTCAAKEVPAPLVDPIGRERPRVVPPGWAWIVIAPEVRALKRNDTVADYCVPFALHVYATMEGVPTVPMVGIAGQQVTLPYDAIKMTPWYGAYILLSYDPSSERWRNRAPTYEITLAATYLPERDLLNAGQLGAFRCALRANGATIVQGLKELSATTVATSCPLKANSYNPY